MRKDSLKILAILALIILVITIFYFNKSNHPSYYYKVEVTHCDFQKKDTVITHQDFYPVIDTYKEAAPVFKVVDSDLGWFYLNKPKQVIPYVCNIRVLESWE